VKRQSPTRVLAASQARHCLRVHTLTLATPDTMIEEIYRENDSFPLIEMYYEMYLTISVE